MKNHNPLGVGGYERHIDLTTTRGLLLVAKIHYHKQ